MSLSETHSAPEPFLVYPDSPASPGYDATAESEDFFSTLLDIINPLQHIPLVSNLYREITGDEISPSARLIGGAVFGGPIGFASASANVLLEQTSGDDIMGHALAMFSDDPLDGVPGVAPQQAGDDTAPQLASAHVDVVAEDIVWSAPRVVPSYAGPDTPTPAAELATAAPLPTPSNALVLATPPAREPEPAVTPVSAATVSPASVGSAPPEWLAAAMKDAASAENALQNGTPPVLTQAKPWVANAILDALDKYEALARTRATDPEASTDDKS